MAVRLGSGMRAVADPMTTQSRAPYDAPVIRVRAVPIPGNGWLCQCQCPRRAEWYWDRIPGLLATRCPMKDCRNYVIVAIWIANKGAE